MKAILNHIAVAVQNLFFSLFFFFFSLFYIPIATSVVFVLSAFIPHRKTMWMTRRAISYYGWLILHCAWPFARVRYKDKSPEDREGPFIFICNHRSASDPFLMACLPYEAIQIAKQWPLRIPVLGIMARIAGYLSIHEMTVESFFEKASQLYNEGVSMVSFPEGTRSGGRCMGQFTSAIFRFAKRIHATIVPLAISGNEDKPPKGSLLLHPGVVHVHKLPALRWEDYKDMSPFKLKNHVRNLLQEEIDIIENRCEQDI